MQVAAQPIKPIDMCMHSHSDSRMDCTVKMAGIEGSERANGANEDKNGAKYLGNGATDEKCTSEPTAVNSQDKCGDIDVICTETHPMEIYDINEGVGQGLEVAEEVRNASKDASIEGEQVRLH